MIIPDKIIIPSFFILLALKTVFWGHSLVEQVLVSFISYMVFVLIWYTTKGGMGLGDAKLSAFISLFLGLKYWCLSILIASFSGVLFCVFMLSAKKMDRKSQLAFGPFLTMGALITLLFK
jgi:prepilin signal peptidase PulO-like enzyme (type II secretory pathway)